MIPISMFFGLLALSTFLLSIPVAIGPKENRPMVLSIFAMIVGTLLAVTFSESLWLVALLGFAQNLAYTFVSRGRNSSSLFYHMIASVFSNGIYALLLFTSVDQISSAKQNPGLFISVYTLATMGGSIFAHWLALRMEKGKARTVTEDKMKGVNDRLDAFFKRIVRMDDHVDMLSQTSATDAARLQLLEMAMLKVLAREEQRERFDGEDYDDMKHQMQNHFHRSGGNPFLVSGTKPVSDRPCTLNGCKNCGL